MRPNQKSSVTSYTGGTFADLRRIAERLTVVSHNPGKNNATTIDKIWDTFKQQHFTRSTARDLQHNNTETTYRRQIANFVRQERPIRLAMIAFPFKANRNPLKTNRQTPDLGELSFLSSMIRLDHAVRLDYAPGVHWTILTEGEFYQPLFEVSDEEISSYINGVKNLISLLDANELFELTPLKNVMESFPDFPGCVQAEQDRIQKEIKTNGIREYESFFQTFLTSQDVRRHPPEMLRHIYKAGGCTGQLTTAELNLRNRLARKAKEMLICYTAINTAKGMVGNGRGAIALTFPDHLYISVTTKPGRYAFRAIPHDTCRLLPHHGVPVLLDNGQKVDIRWLDHIQPEIDTGKIQPIFWANDTEKLPFAYTATNI